MAAGRIVVTYRLLIDSSARNMSSNDVNIVLFDTFTRWKRRILEQQVEQAHRDYVEKSQQLGRFKSIVGEKRMSIVFRSVPFNVTRTRENSREIDEDGEDSIEDDSATQQR